MRNFAAIALIIASAATAMADAVSPRRLVDMHWHLVEERCPSEAKAFRPVGFDRYAETVLSKMSDVDNHSADRLWDDVLAAWEEQDRPYLPSHHGLSFVVAADIQSDSVSAYMEYLKVGRVSDLNPDPAKIFDGALASTALLKCLMPDSREASRFRQSKEKNDRLVVKAIDLLGCYNWVEVSDALLALDIADAGTLDMEKSLSAIGDKVVEKCEGSGKE